MKLTMLLLVHNSNDERETDHMWKTLLFSILGGAAQLASQAVANTVTATGKIDWSHVGTAAIVGAITTVGALHATPPNSQQ